MTLLEQFRAEPNFNEIIVWARRFRWANEIKSKAASQSWIYRNTDVMDKRMERIWQWVREIEPVPTFEGGVLTGPARGLLNMSRISNVFKK
jgi:hypothetical protein